MPTPAGHASRSDRDTAVEASEGEAATTARTTKITVNINAETEKALRMVADREGVSITEALRRLVGYGELLYRTTKVEDNEVLIRRGKELERIHLV